MRNGSKASVELIHVETSAQVRAAVAAFANAAGRVDELGLLRPLAQSTRYWVFDPESNDFGPGKFCGYQGLDLEGYARAQRRDFVGDRFDGAVARQAIERALASVFHPSATHEELLLEWGTRRFGADVFDRVKRSKWCFLDLPGLDATGQSYWALLANPDIYRIDEAICTRSQDLWATRGKDLRRGDRVIVWRAKGRRPGGRGVVALGEVLDDPSIRADAANPCWIDPAQGRLLEPRVRIRYDVPPRAPLWLDQHERVLSKLSVSRATGGAIFRVSPAEWGEVVAQAGGQRLSMPPRADARNVERSRESQGVNHQQRAQRLWQELVSAAAAHRSLTYAELGEATGIHPRALKWPLSLIQDVCEGEDLPPLTSIVVSAVTGLPGRGFHGDAAEHLPRFHAETFAHDWTAVPNPYDYAARGDTEESLAFRLTTAPSSSESVYRLVAVRGRVQAIFRAALLEAYEGACAFCGFSFVEALDAAHIVPWSQCGPEDRMNPTNGILLCANHHGLFDADWIRISEIYEVLYQDLEREYGPYSSMDEQAGPTLHGTKMRLPRAAHLRPAVAKIRARYGR